MQTPNELLPDGLQMDLLWTNASPKSAFVSQTISLNLSNYKLAALIFKPYTYYDTSNVFRMLPIGYGGCFVFDKDQNPSSFTVFKRKIDVSISGIVVYDGYKEMYDGMYITSDNGLLIPYEIYGVK